jgi:hypothetical protein
MSLFSTQSIRFGLFGLNRDWPMKVNEKYDDLLSSPTVKKTLLRALNTLFSTESANSQRRG